MQHLLSRLLYLRAVLGPILLGFAGFFAFAAFASSTLSTPFASIMRCSEANSAIFGSMRCRSDAS